MMKYKISGPNPDVMEPIIEPSPVKPITKPQKGDPWTVPAPKKNPTPKA
jgi:hypothetical protein